MHRPSFDSASDAIPSPGEIVASKYEVLRVLGAGGMGVVVAARHVQLAQQVAIKFMRGPAAHDPTAIERFLREARAVVALSSEHVARVLDVGTLESGAPYIVMEYLAGHDLAAILRESGPLAIRDAVDAILQACDALAEAHSLGIVHRDIKPSNLFVTARRDGSRMVKVLDFGISKSGGAQANGDGLTSSGLVMGSPAYMSPEQARSTKSVDVRSDLWSLGVVLYELLTGVEPFGGESVGEILARVLSEAPALPRSHRPDIPVGLEAVVCRCLERDLASRVQSAAELARQLSPFASRDGARLAERIAGTPAPAEPLFPATTATLAEGTHATAREIGAHVFRPRRDTGLGSLTASVAHRSPFRIAKGAFAVAAALVGISAGAWFMTQRPGVAPHDGAQSRRLLATAAAGDRGAAAASASASETPRANPVGRASDELHDGADTRAEGDAAATSLQYPQPRQAAQPVVAQEHPRIYRKPSNIGIEAGAPAPRPSATPDFGY